MVLTRNRLVLAAVLALAGNHHASAFVPASLPKPAGPRLGFPMTATEPETADVSIDYDAAAKVAYEEWCAKFGKTPSDDRFATFKANFEAISVANVSAAKKAQDAGTERPQDLVLNEYGDMTEAEYTAMMNGETLEEAAPEPEPEKGALATAMEASAAQSSASSALAEAADALYEEEQKLAATLGMDSVEEMEAALDAMEGIAADGGEIDTTDVREARVRSAYMGWCKEYGKEADEGRFGTFQENFLAMEEYAKENNREMVLNKYADCTEEEYRAMTEAKGEWRSDGVISHFGGARGGG